MAAASPTMETVATAIKTRIDTISSIGTVIVNDHSYEDDVEYIIRGGFMSGGSLDLWLIDIASVDEVEGPATGENYAIYNFRIKYWCVRTNATDWSKTARTKAESVRDELNKNASVFAISGQRQLRTPETCSIESHGQYDLRGTEGSQMVYQTILSLSVEARRFS